MSQFELGFMPTLTNLAGRVGSTGAVIDIGAYRGKMSDALKKIYPTHPLFLFEPLPNWAETLTQRYQNNQRIRVQPCAVSDQVGTAEFQVGKFEPTSSLFPRNTSGARYYHPDYEMVESLTVKTTTLDAFCHEESISHISCLKMDTQGAEVKILTGAHDLLGHSAIDIIVTEWFGIAHYEGAPNLNDIWSLLDRYNYTMLDIFLGPKAPNGQLRYGDAIFVSPKVRRNVLSTAL